MLIPLNPPFHPPTHLGPNLLWFHASFVLKICGSSTKMPNAAKSAKRRVFLIMVHSLYAIVLSLIKHYQKSKLSLPSKGKGGFLILTN